MFWLIWQDDSTKKTTAQKIAAACTRYQERFGQVPKRILVNEQDKDVVVPDVSVEPLLTVARNSFWIGPVEGVWL